MGVVCALRFDRESGAILASEESWTVRWQRRFHRVDLHSLLSEEMAHAWGVEAVYGGAGYGPFHDEVVAQTRRDLAALFAAWKKKRKKSDPPAVRDVGEVAAAALQRTLKRRIDQRLQTLYGFTADDVNRGVFQVDGEDYPIRNEKVRDRALQVMAGKEKDPVAAQVWGSRAAILGYDAKKGIDLYHLDAKTGALAYNYEGWEAIGWGHLAAAVPLGKLFNHRDAATRARGMKRERGIYELILAGMTAAQHYYQTERDFAITLVDGRAEKQALRVRELTDERSRLATEIVQTCELGFLRRQAAYGLLGRLVFEAEDRLAVEKALFAEADRPEQVELALRGYKAEDLPGLAGKARKGGRR